MTKSYSGIWPVAPTPFNDDGSLDLSGMKRVIDCMVDQGVDGICILANFSEQFLLSDEERATLTRVCLEHADGRVAQIHGIARDAVGLDPTTQRNGLYNFFSILDDMKRENELLQDWSWAAPRLRRRLQAEWNCPWALVDQPIDRYTNWIVAVATENGCVPVARNWLDGWGVDEPSVWKRATEQSMRPKRLRRRLLRTVEGPERDGALVKFEGDVHSFDGDMFTTGLVADLSERLPEADGAHGALIVAPTAHQFFARPISSLDEVPPMIAPLTVLSILHQETAPNPVSRSVFWYRGPGRLEPCTTHSPTGLIRVTADEPLASVLEEYERHMAA